MKSIRHLLYILLVTILAVSCVEERMPAGVQPADIPCVLNVDKGAISFRAQGGDVQLAIKAENVSWEITGAPSWLVLATKSGTGNATVVMTATENKDVDKTRVAVLQLKSTTAKFESSRNITVTQSIAQKYINPSETSLTLAPQAVQKNITINSNVEWEAVSSAEWLGLSKTDAGTLVVAATENTTAGTRTATITLRRVGTTQALATISVVQSEGGVTGSTERITFDVEGGTQKIDIEADVDWSATTSATSWLSVTPTGGAGGKVSLGITALANKSAAARSAYAYVRIGEENKLAIPVSQDGISFDITGTLENFAGDGSTKQKLTVESNTAWAVLSCPEWLTVTPEQGYKDNTEITLQAAANKSLYSRSATLRIGVEGLIVYKDIIVAQEGVVTDLGNRNLEFGWESSQQELAITVPDSWSAMVSDNWLSLSQNSGNGGETIVVTAAVNPDEDARTGTITVVSEGRSITITAIQQGQYLKINSPAGEVGAMGGNISLTVITSVGASASVEFHDDVTDWVTFDDDDVGNYTLSVAYNPSMNYRTAQFVIKPTMSTTSTACSSGVRFNITQWGRSLSANVSSIAISVAGGASETYTIAADSTYTITKPENDDWYTLQHNAANGTFYIIASENTTGEGRSSQITASLTGLSDGETKDLVIEVLQYDYFNGRISVDLGLPSGTKWATYNVGAISPDDFGDYYAWGETDEKECYDWNTYKWCNGSTSIFTKYSTAISYGTVDYKTVLDIEDDVAHVKWGGSWRMPTIEEQKELIDNCTWTWTTQNGVNGYMVTSRTNGNSIFLPAAGFRNGSELYNAGRRGCYWAVSLARDHCYKASGLGMYDNVYEYVDIDRYSYDWYYYDRYIGMTVRPVCR